jgi:starvation-inducible outer membrane lipoprotein
MKNKIKSLIAALLVGGCVTTPNKIEDPYARVPWDVPAEVENAK